MLNTDKTLVGLLVNNSILRILPLVVNKKNIEELNKKKILSIVK